MTFDIGFICSFSIHSACTEDLMDTKLEIKVNNSNCGSNYLVDKVYFDSTEIIDYRNNNIEKVYKIFPISKNPKLMARKWIRGICQYSSLKKRHKNFESLRKRIKMSKSYTNIELKQKKLDYDLIITGSDQVWNTDITRGFDDIYYLNFPGDYIKGSYAASIGSVSNPDFKKDYFMEKLSAFDRLSVREKMPLSLFRK